MRFGLQGTNLPGATINASYGGRSLLTSGLGTPEDAQGCVTQVSPQCTLP